jgi:drug/metabolite transporter (DMT)-like permease
MTHAPAKSTATLIGFVAVLLWALLAMLTAASGAVPALQLTAISFGVGGLSLLVLRPKAIRSLRQPLPIWLLGVGGLFGYHFAYFFALKNAPPVEASLVNYLWPLLIVVFSAMLPGEQLRWQHVAGCALALAGAVIAVTRGQGFGFDPAYALGYGVALIAAFIWSGYSVLSRRAAHVPSDAVAGFCLATAVLAGLAHLLLETTVWPETSWQWAAVIGLGLGPVGLAFFVWDLGVKHGDIQILGAASYSAPLLSTLVLVHFGFAEFTPTLVLAAILITAGAVLASKDILFARRKSAGLQSTDRPLPEGDRGPIAP